jgi:hypothetical protein
MAEPLTAAERMELGAGRPVWRSEEPDCHFCPCCYAEIQRYEATVQAAEAERDRRADLVALWQALAAEFRQLAQRRSAEITAPLEPVVAAARAWAATITELCEVWESDGPDGPDWPARMHATAEGKRDAEQVLVDAVAALEAGEKQGG